MSLFGNNLPEDSKLPPPQGIAHGTTSGREDGCNNQCCDPPHEDSKYNDGPQERPKGIMW